MLRSARLFRTLALAGATLLAASACALDEKSEDKGLVDESLPPDGDPATTGAGKADGEENVVLLDVQSPHPYANNLNRVFTVDLASLPSCANQARLHFKVLRTEAGYDTVTVEGLVDPAQQQSFDGTHDDTWTEWFSIRRAGDGQRALAVRLESDYSVRMHGFEIDGVQWSGSAMCPLMPIQPCPEGTIRTNPPRGACECDGANQCTGSGLIAIDHRTSQGRMNSGKRLVGTTAYNLGVAPTDGILATEIGAISITALEGLVYEAIGAGLFHGPGYGEAAPISELSEWFTITVGEGEPVVYVSPVGQHTPEVAALIARFEALFTCGQDEVAGAVDCADGYICDAGTCIEDESCICPEIYQPVCGVDGRTYSNACSMACSEVDAAHDGECGIAGDMCGGLLGLPCTEQHKCRYDASTYQPPYPDAAGTCVGQTYCDAPADCLGLAHPAVLGAWACPATTSACTWQAGTQWQAVTAGTFETAHPYSNNESVWKELTLPAEAQAMRLVASGTFDLESGYDFLEVWTWQNAKWVRVKRYTGSTAPSATDEFAGRYHYLKFVSDTSVRRHGFSVAAQYR